MKATVSELRIPADPAYIVVAKRAAAGFGYIAGLDIEAVDDLCIAVAQACENAISCAAAVGGQGGAQIRLGFKLQDQQLEVQVRSQCGRTEEVAGAAPQPPVGVEPRRRAAVATHAVALDEALTGEAAARDLALRVMGLFVDDCRYRVDERTGGLRVRLTKYRLS